MPETAERTLEEYKSGVKPTWCPGCGDFGVLNAVYNALRVKGYAPENVVLVSGIGCSSRLPFFSSTYGFHTIHGRTMPIATGIKVANPNLTVLALGGDGDAFAIGGGHFIHAARRNLDLCYVIMDNAIYGLTKGQTSPTSMVGFVTKTTPKGTPDRPVNPLQLALASGATFVARAFSGKPKELADLIVQGVEHRGFAVIDAYSPCPTFNKVNTFKYYRDEAVDLPKDHDPADPQQAWARAASVDPVYLGLLYRSEAEGSFEDHIQSAIIGSEADAARVIEEILERYS
ncbi:MAG TPA: 2-oxoacid:ferredoxin oxidoreductase subunit beta [Chloroflexota bacterium]|jgi:2-oxoglutarate ferredoxin oxidoreductase subunit beta|nr:2-oxoacid:ferredoxin oxidoreductase subunit beta [Chloroflexota bacterium]